MKMVWHSVVLHPINIMMAPSTLLTFLTLLATAQGQWMGFDNIDTSNPCIEMYSRSDIPGGGAWDPWIQVQFMAGGWQQSNATLSIIVYEYRDRFRLGVPRNQSVGGDQDRQLECNENAVRLNYCKNSSLNTLLYEHPSDMAIPGQPSGNYAPIDQRQFTANNLTTLLQDPTQPLWTYQYIPVRKGIYCTRVYMFEGVIQKGTRLPTHVVRNAYGWMPAVVYPLLPLYGLISLTYLVIGLVWMGMSAMYWREILPVQNYIAGVIFVLMLNHAFLYGFYEYWNGNADGSFSYALLVMVVLLDALRNAISFFVILIVALGYGVVKPTLGDQMKKCITLGVLLFFSFVIFSAGTYFSENTTVLQALFIILPLSILLTIYFSWTHTALQTTIQHLQLRKQTYKIEMYTYLWRVLLFAALALLVMMIVNTVVFPLRSDMEWRVYNWPVIWLLRDGWMTFLYFLCFCTIAFMWRPTKNNARYGLEELPDNEQFDLEMGAFGSSGGEGGDANRPSMSPDQPGFGQHIQRRTRGPGEGSDVLFDQGAFLNSEDGSDRGRSASPGGERRALRGGIGEVYAVDGGETDVSDTEGFRDVTMQALGGGNTGGAGKAVLSGIDGDVDLGAERRRELDKLQ